MTRVSRRYAHPLNNHKWYETVSRFRPEGQEKKACADAKLRRQTEKRTRADSLTQTIYAALRTCRRYLPYGDRKRYLGRLISSSEPFSQSGGVTAVVPGWVWHRREGFFFFFFLAVFYWKRQGGRGLTWLPQKCTWGGAFTALTCKVLCHIFNTKTPFIYIFFNEVILFWICLI